MVGKFIEFFGDGIKTFHYQKGQPFQTWLLNMVQHVVFFPVDNETLKYLEITGRDKKKIKVVEKFCKKQKLWHDKDNQKIIYNDILEINLNQIKPS